MWFICQNLTKKYQKQVSKESKYFLPVKVLLSFRPGRKLELVCIPQTPVTGENAGIVLSWKPIKVVYGHISGQDLTTNFFSGGGVRQQVYVEMSGIKNKSDGE